MFQSSLLALVLFVAFAACVNVGDPDPSFDCSSTQDQDCRGPKDCLFPNPRNCSQFYQCTGGEGSFAYLRECAFSIPLLQFDPSQDQCDWPWVVNCRESEPPPEPEPEPEPEPQPTTTTTTTQAPEQPEETTTPQAEPETTTPPAEEAPTTTPPAEEAPTTPAPTEAPAEETTTPEAVEDPPETTSPPPDNAPEPDPTTEGPAETTTEEPDEPTTPPTTTTTTTTTAAPPTPTRPDAVSIVCPSPEAVSNISAGCQPPRNCMFTNPFTCQGYVQCVTTIIGYEMDCQSDDRDRIYWNDNTVTCEYLYNSTCPSRPSMLFRAPIQLPLK